MHRFGPQCSAADTAERWRDMTHHDWQASRPLSVTLLTRPSCFIHRNRACGNSFFFFSFLYGPLKAGPCDINLQKLSFGFFFPLFFFCCGMRPQNAHRINIGITTVCYTKVIQYILLWCVLWLYCVRVRVRVNQQHYFCETCSSQSGY